MRGAFPYSHFCCRPAITYKEDKGLHLNVYEKGSVCLSVCFSTVTWALVGIIDSGDGAEQNTGTR